MHPEKCAWNYMCMRENAPGKCIEHIIKMYKMCPTIFVKCVNTAENLQNGSEKNGPEKIITKICPI